MISLSPTKLILLMAITSSTSALLSMETDQIKVVNFLTDKSIRARILGPEKGTYLTKLSPEDKTPFKLSIYEQDNTRRSTKLTLEKNQTSIAVMYSSGNAGLVVVKDNQTRTVLATL
jgi:hypothetical protein